MKDSNICNSTHFVFFEKEFPLLIGNQESNQTPITFSVDEAQEEYFDFQEFLDEEEVQYNQETCDEQNNDDSNDHTSSEDEERSNPDSDHHPTAKRIRVIGP
ncbi:hypothetical protein O181_023722 [Austropuccinia psidii MF-1]|uniref:Uncharacterized protein n=1 Tax=Austropuccinia psidii MF-1 TaxID=1389203 RepID=A0A9Q3CK27_9BASI|nr:hypothetical protein [Austropuccinia psidii MF-1]